MPPAPIALGPVVLIAFAQQPADRLQEVDVKLYAVVAIHLLGILILVNTAPKRSIPGSFASGNAAITPTTASPKIM